MPSGFLTPDSDAVARQRRQLEARAAGRPLVGLSWRSRNAAYGQPKSLALTDLLPLLRRDVFWVDVQYGDTAEERAAVITAGGPEIWRDPDIDPLQDLDAAAAQVAALDLVITSSNTAAHLAGALGVPTWLLLPAPGYGLLWYWFLDRSDSPFYPTLRCFRQSRPGNWADAVAAVAEALDAWRAGRADG